MNLGKEESLIPNRQAGNTPPDDQAPQGEHVGEHVESLGICSLRRCSGPASGTRSFGFSGHKIERQGVDGRVDAAGICSLRR